MRRLPCIALLLAPAFVATAAPNYNAVYNEAYQLLEAGRNSEARSKFQIVLEAPPESGLLDNAEYWIANSFLRESNYNEAVRHYKRAQVLPDGNKHAASQFELAKALSMAGDSIGAVIEYYKVLTLYPDEDEGNLAKRALARIDSLGDFSKPAATDSQSTSPPLYSPQTRPTPASIASIKPRVQTQTQTPPPPKPEAVKPEAQTAAPKAYAQVQPQSKPETAPAPPQTIAVKPESAAVGKPAEGNAQQKTTPPPPVTQPQGETAQAQQPPAPAPITPQPAQTAEGQDSTGSAPAIGGLAQYSQDSMNTQYTQDYPEGEVPGVPWDQPSPVKREDGILTLPLHADPRTLILPKDKQGF